MTTRLKQLRSTLAGLPLLLEVLVFVLAAASRLTVILRAGGLRGAFGYDASVYFGAADALTHGRMPYRDFVLLHPPVQMLALTPFALLTRIVSDENAFTLANLSFAVLGAINSVLVMRVCRRLGLSTAGALAGALFYALWFGAVSAEYLAKLEPLGNFFLLCAILAALRAQQQARWTGALAGVALGLAVSVKIWWIVPAAGVIVWHPLVTRLAKDGLTVLAGAVGSAVAVNLPFFVLAPRQMWSAIVVQQLGRAANAPSRLGRIADLTTLPRLGVLASHIPQLPLAVVATALLMLVVARAWPIRTARPAVGLVLIQLFVLFAAPSWFPAYTDYVAVGFAVVIAAAVTPRPDAAAPRRWMIVSWIPTVAASGLTLLILVLGTAAVHPFAGARRLAREVAGVRCVMSDSPLGEIQLNALSRDLANGCPNWVDVTGETYGRDRSPTGATRINNLRWQRDLTRYLRSGQAVIIVRRSGTGISRQTQAAISRDGVLGRAAGRTVYRVNARPASGNGQ